MAIQVVVFDIGGIFEIDPTAPPGSDPSQHFPEMFARWETRLGMSPGEMDRRLAKWDQVDPMTNDIPWVERRAQAQTLLGLSDAQTEEFCADFWDTYCGEPNTELIEYARRLRTRVRTAMLSNSGAGAREEEERRFQFSDIAEQIIYSHEVGVKKPDRRIYEITCERLGVRPEQVIFLDNYEPNVTAAREHGIHGIFYQGNAQATADIEACLKVHQ